MRKKENIFKKNGYDLVIGSPLEYEELVVYVIINGGHIALVQKEEGKDKVKVEIFGEAKVDYDVFLEALQAAKEELLE